MVTSRGQKHSKPSDDPFPPEFLATLVAEDVINSKIGLDAAGVSGPSLGLAAPRRDE
jgi:hypothetical protein